MVFLQSLAEDNSTSTCTCTVCADFPPNSGANNNSNRQQSPSTAAAPEHPSSAATAAMATATAAECCITSTGTAAVPPPPITTTCPLNNGTMPSHQNQQHNLNQTSNGDGDGCGVPPSSDQSLGKSSAEGEEEEEEEEEEEGGSSEMAKLAAPQNATYGVIPRRVFDVSGSVNRAVCPIRPKLDVCMLVRSSLIHFSSFVRVAFHIESWVLTIYYIYYFTHFRALPSLSLLAATSPMMKEILPYLQLVSLSMLNQRVPQKFNWSKLKFLFPFH